MCLGHLTQPVTGHKQVSDSDAYACCPLPITTVVKAVAQATATGFAAALNGCGVEAVADGTANATKEAVAAALAKASAEACSTGGVSKAVAEAVSQSIVKYVSEQNAG